MIIAAAVYNEYYRPLAEKTLFENRVHYCIKNGYPFAFQKCDVEIEDDYKRVGEMSFEKIKLILHVFKVTGCSHVWMADVDAMVMNMGITIESLIEKFPHDLVVGSDFNGISTGSFIARNCEDVRVYFEEMLQVKDQYLHEQDYVWKNPMPFIFTTDQRVMNSHDTTLQHLHPNGLDYSKAQYQTGDFLIHWPAQSLSTRLIMYEKWKGKVINA